MRNRVVIILAAALLVLVAGVILVSQIDESHTAAPTLDSLGPRVREVVVASETFKGTGSTNVESRIIITSPPSNDTSQSKEFVREALRDAGYVFRSQDGAINQTGVCVSLDSTEGFVSFPGRLSAEREFVELSSEPGSVIVTMLYC